MDFFCLNSKVCQVQQVPFFNSFDYFVLDSVPKPSPSKRKEERRFSFSSSLRKYSPPPTSPGKSPNKGKGGFGFATSPMSPTSPMRTGTSRTLRFSPNMSSPMGSPTLQGAANSTNHIPFSQRQSKSKVAAREILKKGESVNYTMIHIYPTFSHHSFSNLEIQTRF